MTNATREVLEALEGMGKEVLHGKGGFWIRGEGFITLAQARKLTGVKAQPREKKEKVYQNTDWNMLVGFVNGRHRMAKKNG